MAGHLLRGQESGMSLIPQSVYHTADRPICETGGVQSISVNEVAVDDIPGFPECIKLGRLVGSSYNTRLKQQTRTA